MHTALTDNSVRLTFPSWTCEVDTETHSITVLVPRNRLPELQAFIAALELGLIDTGMRGIGEG